MSPRSRRRALLVFASIGLGATRAAVAQTSANAPTPADMEGPYYPPQRPNDAGPNLRAVGGRPAVGPALDLEGQVRDTSGRALAGVTLELWQTDGHGNYLHPAAPLLDGKTPRDPGFAGFGRTLTDAQGRYRFQTIRPLPYAGRPPHLHLKLFVQGREVLTTQLYFPSDGVSRRRALTVELLPARNGAEQARFDFVLTPSS